LHFRYSIIRIPYGWRDRKTDKLPGIASAHKIEGAPLDDTFVAILGDGRVLLSNQPPDHNGDFINAMKPLRFVDGYLHEEKLDALKAVLRYLKEHV
jgi:hypothetical protein